MWRWCSHLASTTVKNTWLFHIHLNYVLYMDLKLIFNLLRAPTKKLFWCFSLERWKRMWILRCLKFLKAKTLLKTSQRLLSLFSPQAVQFMCGNSQSLRRASPSSPFIGDSFRWKRGRVRGWEVFFGTSLNGWRRLTWTLITGEGKKALVLDEIEKGTMRSDMLMRLFKAGVFVRSLC